MAFEDFDDGDPLPASQLDTLSRQGLIVCTSSTRPGSPSEGMHIYETNTNRMFGFDGASWVLVPINFSAAGRCGWRLRRTTNQNVPNNSATFIAWDTEDRDSDGFHAGSGDSISIPTGLNGIYSMTFSVVWSESPSSAGNAVCEIDAGGRVVRNPVGDADFSDFSSVTLTDELNDGDTVQAKVVQITGGTIQVTEACLSGYRLMR